MQKYIYEQEAHWFTKLEPYVYGKVLKIGSGLGYMTSFIRKNHPSMRVLEVRTNESDPNSKNVDLYDGKIFPFDSNSFDCSVSTYVLHHTPDPVEIILEMRRVSKRIIILEETYTNLFSKIDLCYRDIYVNTLANQPSKIYWGSYFQESRLKDVLKDLDLNVIFSKREKKRSYFKQLYVLEKS